MSQPRPPKHFTLEPERDGDTVFVRLGGEFDLAAERYFEHTAGALGQAAQKIVVDLSGLTFIDSSGMRALLRLWKTTREDGLDLAIVPGSAQVRHTMELTGVDRVLPIVKEAPPGATPTLTASD